MRTTIQGLRPRHITPPPIKKTLHELGLEVKSFTRLASGGRDTTAMIAPACQAFPPPTAPNKGNTR